MVTMNNTAVLLLLSAPLALVAVAHSYLKLLAEVLMGAAFLLEAA